MTVLQHITNRSSSFRASRSIGRGKAAPLSSNVSAPWMIRYLAMPLILLLTSCAEKVPVHVAAEQMIYEALFLEIIGDAVSVYYIADQTEDLWFKKNSLQSSQAAHPEFPASLMGKLYEKNESAHELDWEPIITNGNRLSIKYDYALASRAKKCLVQRDQSHIGVRHSSGLYFRPFYSVSRVAFSEDRTEALVKYSRHCAPLSGAGEFLVLFEYRDQGWHIKAEAVLWVS